MSSSAPAPGIAVIGAGIGGLTLAAALARLGIGCRVFERAEQPAEAGAGVQLAPNAVRLLRRLGLSDSLRQYGVRPLSRDLLRWDDGRTLARTELGEECEKRFGAPYVTVHRADLHRALRDLAGAVVRTGHRLTGLTEGPGAVELRFADGSEHRAELVVGADGIRSVVREHLAADAPVFSGRRIYRGLVPVERVPELAEPRVRVWLGPGRHCVCYPVSGGRLISFAATTGGTAHPGESWTAIGDQDEVAEAYRDWHPTVTRLLGAGGGIGCWALHDREPLARWSSDALTLLGDAAHPMLPFAAQGANQAIEDAFALAATLAMSRGDVPEALRRYQEQRIPRTQRLQQSARSTAIGSHLPDGPLQRARDAELARGSALDGLRWVYGHDALAAAARWTSERQQA
ncbi:MULTISPECIES: FAD-dependent monooxygenase [unclassified Streptomyces]|uniref:FAD-dependent monooxygenase n=1 Tax=Streptomyces sp. NPDC088719 TaxID=3365872 RepID=UPI00381C09FA